MSGYDGLLDDNNSINRPIIISAIQLTAAMILKQEAQLDTKRLLKNLKNTPDG